MGGMNLHCIVIELLLHYYIFIVGGAIFGTPGSKSTINFSHRQCYVTHSGSSSKPVFCVSVLHPGHTMYIGYLAELQ